MIVLGRDDTIASFISFCLQFVLGYLSNTSGITRGDMMGYLAEPFMLPSGNVAKEESYIIPSGKRLHNYGKSPFSIGKSTINRRFQ